MKPHVVARVQGESMNNFTLRITISFNPTNKYIYKRNEENVIPKKIPSTNGCPVLCLKWFRDMICV